MKKLFIFGILLFVIIFSGCNSVNNPSYPGSGNDIETEYTYNESLRDLTIIGPIKLNIVLVKRPIDGAGYFEDKEKSIREIKESTIKILEGIKGKSKTNNSFKKDKFMKV